MRQRSHVSVWLLLAATLSVYAFVALWVASEPFPTPPFAWALFDALTLALLSLVCICSSLRPARNVWSRLAPFVAVPLASFVVTTVVNDPVAYWTRFSLYLFYYGLCAGLLLATLWFLRRTTFWQRRTGTTGIWQFSMAELLIVMTFVAVLAAVIRQTPFLGGDGWFALAFLGSSVAVALTNVVFWSFSAPWHGRLAAATGIAILLGAALAMISDSPDIVGPIIGADLLIQSLLVSLWLGCGDILPAPGNANAEPVPPQP